MQSKLKSVVLVRLLRWHYMPSFDFIANPLNAPDLNETSCVFVSRLQLNAIDSIIL